MREVGSLVGFENPLRGSDLCHPFDARPCFKIPGLDLLEGIFFFFNSDNRFLLSVLSTSVTGVGGRHFLLLWGLK